MIKYMDRFKNMLAIALVIALAAQINMDAPHVAPGFVFAVDVIVLDVCIFCFSEKYTPMQIALISAIFSPAFRFLASMGDGGTVAENASNCFPDAVFFIMYGIALTLWAKSSWESDSPMVHFFISIFLADFIGNLGEVFFLSLMRDRNFMTLHMFNSLIVIALARTAISALIILTMDSYMQTQGERAQLRKIQSMVDRRVTISDEMHFIRNSKEDVERVLKEAYDLHRDMGGSNVPEEFTRRVLDIARKTHEIKGCYQEVLDTLDNLNRNSGGKTDFRMSEILCFVQNYTLKTAASHHLKVELTIDSSEDFRVRESHKVISILRNLTVNALEAFSGNKGAIRISVSRCSVSPEDCYRIAVEDNGPGIEESELETIFLPGYSTKMDPETGFVQRGLGLSLVKDYVERDFEGSIQVMNRQEGGTRFVIEIPQDKLEEDLP